MVNFNIGDSIELIQPEGIHDLEVNKSYIVIDIKYRDNKQFISIEGTGIMTDYSPPYPNTLEYHFYNSIRFRRDIRIVRKKKLQNIWK